MLTPALRVENVSKMYRLGEVGTGSLSHDLNRAWARLRGRPDPYARVGAVNDRTSEGTQGFVWALRDINFEVGQGEIVGIIGRNGAGKSTLLKLLSRVTAPTEGNIFINGRIASLLEVGTGFHPDLTGRENIFLNGAILGMNKQEIRARFDEIVEFSGCAKYIDTPVKRYSSGMHVRLAFAVAAHLETDILIVDEVLAVGDAEFQQRCLGKMKDLSTSGHRTVLFVSHNMASIRNLCPRSILVDKGSIRHFGNTVDVIEKYLSLNAKFRQWKYDGPARSEHGVVLDQVLISGHDGDPTRPLSNDEPIQIAVSYDCRVPQEKLRVSVSLVSTTGEMVFSSSDFPQIQEGAIVKQGPTRSICTIPGRLLNKGSYEVEIRFEVPARGEAHPPFTAAFEISSLDFSSMGPIMADSPPGVVHPQLDWRIETGMQGQQHAKDIPA